MCSVDWGIECLGLSRSFGAREALVDVDLRVRRGSLVALVGSNGAGKTTLMKILATLLTSSSGTARVLGHDAARCPMECRRSIGYAAAEERSFYGRLTVLQNLAFFASLQGMCGAEFRARSVPLLETFGLEPHGKRRFAELSSGMKQSLSMVRSLLHDPPVLLLDEPTRSLSPDLAHHIWEQLRQLAHDKGKTILLATHNLGEVESVADEMAILHRGRLIIQGAADQLCRTHGVEGTPKSEALFRHFLREPLHAAVP
jgi:ABC-type multidrug transport system ATPase subunit